MFEYDIKRFNRRCAKTGLEFKPGDVYFSVVIEEGEGFTRLDFGVDAWEGPPEGALGWWRSQVASADPNRVFWAPPAVLLEYFGKLSESKDQSDLYYLMSLVLLRKRLLQLMDRAAESAPEHEIRVHAPRLKQDFTVPIREIGAERMRQLQADLCEQLFCDQPLDSEEVEPVDVDAS